MIIDNLDCFGGAIAPDEADAPLVVDPDAVLSLAIAFERFEPITGRRANIGQLSRRVEHIELATGGLFE